MLSAAIPSIFLAVLGATGVPGRAGVVPVRLDTAIIAGGCFWSMERPFQHMKGVVRTTVGYSGGVLPHPTYEEVSTGKTGHLESVEIVYNPAIVSYAQILDRYWHNIDPLSHSGQFCDAGPEYRTAIFVTAEQAATADLSRTKVASQLHGRVATVIRPRVAFYPAEAYHQDYAERNPVAYGRYRAACGRDQRLRELWGAAAEPGVPPPPPL